MTPSVAVEFDTWANSELQDAQYQHIAFLANGDVGTETHAVKADIFDSTHEAWIEYHAESHVLKVFVGSHSSPLSSETLNLSRLQTQEWTLICDSS